MNSSRTAHIVTVAVMAAIFAGVVWQRSERPSISQTATEISPSPSDSAPQDAIYAMFDAEKAGDVPGYLNCYTGTLKASLQQTAAEMSAEGFGRSLQQRNAPLKGLAISEPEKVSETEVVARVDYVYADRNEQQKFFLEKINGAWKIARVDAANGVKPPVPFGTPVE